MSEQKAPSHNIRLSKSLSRVLRHSAIKDGFKISSEGFIKVSDLLKSNLFKSYSFEDIENVVNQNDKKRFTLKQIDGEYYIRANQGHSIKVENLELSEIKSIEDLPEGVIIHGTFKKNWQSIKFSGLNKLTRNHIHFSIGLPGSENVKSGVRNNSEVLIYINFEKAINDGIKFYRSENDVILSEGKNGIISSEYFEYVIDAKTLKPFDKNYKEIPPHIQTTKLLEKNK